VGPTIDISPSAINTTAPDPSADEHKLGKSARCWKLGCPPVPGASGSKDIARTPPREWSSLDDKLLI